MSITLSGLSTEEYNTGSFEVQSEILEGQFNVNAWLGGYRDILGEGKPVKKEIVQWTQGLELIDHSDPTELTHAENGFNNINWNTRRTLNDYFLTWSLWVAEYPIAVSFLEQKTSKLGAMGIAKKRVANVTRAAMRRLEKNQLAGGQIGHTALNHWNGVDYTTGLAQAAAFGSQSNAVGGLARTIPAIAASPLLQNQWVGGANSVNALGIDAAGIVNARFQSNAPDSLSKRRFGVATNECFAAYTKLDGVRVMNGSDPTNAKVASAMTLMVGGVPVKTSPYMPTTGTNTTTTPISMYWFTPEDHPFYWLDDLHFLVADWQEVMYPTQHLLVSMLTVGGQQVVESLASMALFTKFQGY